MEKPRAALWLWYLGQRFAGFQRQPSERTVQQAVSEALVRAGARDVVMPAGRTDRGVHARMQVVTVRASPEVAERLDFGDEADAVGVAAAVRPGPTFHALWSATGRTYRYRLTLGGQAPEAWAPFVWRARENARLEGRVLDPARLAEAVALLPGTRAFSAFHESSSVQKPRTLSCVRLLEGSGDGSLLELELTGDAFGRHQVRELVGACVLVAAGVEPLSRLQDSLESGAPFPSLRAPGRGLVLWEVHYPAAVDPFPASLRATPNAAVRLPDAPPFSEARARTR